MRQKQASLLPTVDVVSPTYQPSKAEKDADMRVNAPPEDVARSVMQPVNTRTIRRPKKRRA